MSDRELPTPNFLIIGAQKSATRWLRSNLGEHPEIFTAPMEISYFNQPKRVRRWGMEMYRAQFAGWDGEPFVGEATPGYMMWRHHPAATAKRIDEALPGVKLIAILRDPIDRAHSALLHHGKQERLPSTLTLVSAVERTPPDTEWLNLIAGGWYAASLRPFVEIFGDRLLVLFHDDLATDPVGLYLRAVRHIGASEGFVPSGLAKVRYSNQSSLRRRKSSAPTLEERERLWPYFEADVLELEQMFDRDLSRWRPARRPPAEVAEGGSTFRRWSRSVRRRPPAPAAGRCSSSS